MTHAFRLFNGKAAKIKPTSDGLPRKLEIIKDGKYSSSKKDSEV